MFTSMKVFTNKLLKKSKESRLQAFTLMEVLTTLIIIGIVISYAMPDNTSLIVEAKMMEAQGQLKHVVTLEKLYHAKYSKYCPDFKEMRYTPPTLVTDGGNANYKIEIVEATSNSFKVRATSVSDFDGDGVFNTWEVNQDDKLTEVTQD